MTKEEQRDFDSFNEASTNSQNKKGKALLWKVFQENMKFYSQARQAIHQSDSSQAPILVHSEAGSQHQLPQLALAQPQAQTHVFIL